MSTLVAYYSRAGQNYGNGGVINLPKGNTEILAEAIAADLGADLFKIETVEPYPEDYFATTDQAKRELRDQARPAIQGPLPNMEGGAAIVLGCPIWWGDEPMIVRTFIEGVDLAGKTIVPFTTHGGSGLGRVPANLAAALPDCLFLDGLAVAGVDVDGAHDQVVEWAKGYALA